MKITVQNIEAYLLDYCTNQLSQKDRNAVDAFILENPELKVRVEELIHLPLEHFVFPNKDRLKKEILENEAVLVDDDENNRECLLFLVSEGQLDVEQKKKIDEWSQRDLTFKKEVEFAEQIRFLPDEDIRYPNKKALKRRNQSKLMRVWLGAAAASVALLISFYLGQQTSTKPSLRAQIKAPQTSDSLIKNHARITNHSKGQKQVVNASVSDTDHSINSKNRIKQYSQKQISRIDSVIDQEIIQDQLPDQLPDQFVEYKAKDTLLTSDDIDSQKRQFDTIQPQRKATKTELVKPSEYVTAIRSTGKRDNWTAISRRLASISKNKLIFKGSSSWDFAIKIGKFSFSRNKYSSKSNLSMR